jgi:hypothetical protein
VQAVGDVHDTPSSSPGMYGGGRRIDQLVPFQRSISGASQHSIEAVWRPTAVQAVGDVHDTAFKVPTKGRTWLAVGWIDQRFPFQRSTNATWPLLARA